MKLKSLILGSAAALVAVTGARAADAVIAEPEPVEYVRVCDMFGTGFYYIPGTETCFRIDGYVWYQIGTTHVNGGTNEEWQKSTRVRLNFDARSETEWGTLRGFIRVQATWNAQNQNGTVFGAAGAGASASTAAANQIGLFSYGGDGNATIDQAIIELGGLRMGYTESAWAQTQNGGSSNWGSHSWSGLAYGYQQRQLVAYTFSGGNGFFGTLSVEDDGNGNYTPDVVGKIGVSQGWGTVWAKAAYDEDIGNAIIPRNVALARSGADGWGASVGAHINIPNMAGSSLRLMYFYSDSLNAYSVGAEHSVLASYYHQFTSTFGASLGGQYMWDLTPGAAGSVNAWQVELNLVWVPITNFEVRGEYNYSDNNGAGNNQVHTGFLRFTRYF